MNKCLYFICSQLVTNERVYVIIVNASADREGHALKEDMFSFVNFS